MELREFERADCWLCGDDAVWVVREFNETLLTCEEHKMKAFS